MPDFQSVPRGTCGHAAMPSADGFTACHTSTYGCPVTSTFGSRTAGHEPGLFAAGDEMVDEHADPPVRVRAELAQRVGEMVDAVQRFDDHALDAQVVAPDAFEQRRVVDAFDPDPARPRNARAGAPATAYEPDAVFAARVGARRRGRADEGHRAAVEQERRGQHREHPPLAVPVLERDGVALLARVDGPADRTTAPQNPPSAVSTTRSVSAGTSGTVRRRAGRARTSVVHASER